MAMNGYLSQITGENRLSLNLSNRVTFNHTSLTDYIILYMTVDGSMHNWMDYIDLIMYGLQLLLLYQPIYLYTSKFLNIHICLSLSLSHSSAN